MLNSGKKIRALRERKKNIRTLVLSEKTISVRKNNHSHSYDLKDHTFILQTPASTTPF